MPRCRKSWLERKRTQGKEIEMMLAWNTIAYSTKVRNGGGGQWWKPKRNYCRPKAPSPTGIKEYWMTPKKKTANNGVWERLKLWRAPSHTCSLHKKHMCCKTPGCRFGKQKK